MNKTAALEILRKPYPDAALLARPSDSPMSSPAGGDALRQEVADLRELVKRLAGEVKELRAIVEVTQTVCCVCGKADCYEAPHVPLRFWMRFGRDAFRAYSHYEPERARQAEREHCERRYRGWGAQGFYDEQAMYDPRALPFR